MYQAGLKLMVTLLPQLPVCWNNMYTTKPSILCDF